MRHSGHRILQICVFFGREQRPSLVLSKTSLLLTGSGGAIQGRRPQKRAMFKGILTPQTSSSSQNGGSFRGTRPWTLPFPPRHPWPAQEGDNLANNYRFRPCALLGRQSGRKSRPCSS